MYEQWQSEGDDQDQSITIFDQAECIKITADLKSFTPPDPNIILTVTDNLSSNTSQYLDKDTFVLHDITYVIDDESLTKPQIYLSPQADKRNTGIR